MKDILRAAVIVGVVSALLPSRLYGQWMEQTFSLQSGWNSIYLEVDPSPANAEQIFAGLPVDTVWTPANDLVVKGPPDCLDPLSETSGCAPPNQSDWHIWVLADRQGSIATTLRLLRGGRTYLVKATAAGMLRVVGKPNASRTRWRQGFNLAGFHVISDPAAAPTFQSYLAASSAHAGCRVFSLQASGTLSEITTLSTTKIIPGRGYWVSVNKDTEYDGAIEIDLGSLRGLDFAQSLTDHSITIRNLSSLARTISMTAAVSSPVPAAPPGLPTLAGSIPVSWLDYGGGSQVTDVYQWRSLPQTCQLAAVGLAGDRKTIRLAANRASLAEAVLDSTGQGSQYQSLLTVSDGAGYRRVLPLTAQVPNRSGLWVGHVTVNSVAWVTAPLSGGGDSTATRPTSSEFTFPIIIHRGASTYKMLTEVTMMWRPGNEETGAPGEYVLVTPDASPALVAQLQAGSLKDGQPFSRRISTAAFAFDHDLPLSGGFETALSGSITIPANHRLNPFHHRYHPDHDGDQTGENYELTREFTLTFDPSPPPGTVTSGWGNSYLAGRYSESLKGLYKVSDTTQVPVNTAGRFELQRVSQVPTLNDE
jgi:hypothetical protein